MYIADHLMPLCQCDADLCVDLSVMCDMCVRVYRVEGQRVVLVFFDVTHAHTHIPTRRCECGAHLCVVLCVMCDKCVSVY